MRRSFIFAGFLLLALTVAAAGPDQARIEEVRKGIRTEAIASWWGFDENDATDCLQNAVNSGAKILTVPNMGKPWIISRTIRLAGNQEIVLAKGTVIEAKKGAFKPTWLGLFLGSRLENFTLRGEGDNILRMHIDDYNDQKLYKLSEYRHGIYLAGCRNVRIANLTVRDTGGDGLAMGNRKNPCRDVLIENVVFDNNNRLGISIVSGEDITIRKCSFLNARHMPPSGGIDMEPNFPDESISNILIEDCVFLNNKFNAVTVAVNNLNASSKPVSVTLRNCRKTENNALALWVQAMKPAGSGCQGRIVIENCRLSNPLMFTNITAEKFSIQIKDTELALPALTEVNELSRSAVAVISSGNHDREIGEIVFDNVRIVSPGSKRQALALRFDGSARCVTPFKGTFLNNGKQVDFRPIVEQCRARLAELRSLKKPDLPDLNSLVPVKGAAASVKTGRMPLRRRGIFLLQGTKGRQISFWTKVLKFYKSKGDLVIESPSGRELEKKTLSYEQTDWLEHSFIPEETGIYQVKFNPGINALEIRSDFPSGLLAKDGETVLVKPCGRMYFTVPTGTDKFTFTVSARPGADVRIIDPAGKIRAEKKKIASAEILPVRCKKSSEDQVWAIDIRQAVWETMIRMHAPLIPILSDDPATLLKPKRQ
ncbi:MAG: right-handed parallel beta-helix repeat-containing protein [Lentisphaerae bacterium]|nr:right-handed parallel beta-helix repeat-containing protein [Lentisphaerota bacterium]